MGKVIGIGGVFLRSADPERLARWYSEHLGVALNDWGGATFEITGTAAWATQPVDGPQTAVVNYRVEDLPGLLESLEAAGVWVDPERPEDDYGRFAWIKDCDGNRVELWEVTASG